MEKADIIAFFDREAPHWDAEMVKDDAIIGKILDGAGLKAGMDVLDVACGTGVMIPYYLDRNAGSVTAIDISPEMARIAAKKFPEARVICGDAETAAFDRKFDCVMIYNAFPHFPDPEALIRRLSYLLKPGGSLTVAHGMSRSALDAHHRGRASRVSMGLMHQDDLAALFEKTLSVTVKLSDEKMYQVTGIRAAE